MNGGVIFEKIDEINGLYSDIYACMKGGSDPFMEIGVTDDKLLVFTF